MTPEKRRIADLAALGGEALFREPLHVGRPSMSQRAGLLRRFEGILDRQWFTNDGPLVRELEQAVAAHLQVRHAVAMANATAALEVLLSALEVEGEVIVPAYTFVATAHAARWLGHKTIFSDVIKSTHNVDPIEVAALVSDRTAAIVGVHLWGRPCAVGQLTSLAKERNIPLILDAAHAFGCSIAGTRIGNFGAAEVFSFHATKFVTSGEGGMVTTNDDDLAARLRLMRNFGFAGIDRPIALGTNAKMSEFSAAVGLSSLEGMTDAIAENRRCHDRYRSGLEDVTELSVGQYSSSDSPNYHYAVVEVSPSPGGMTRDDLVDLLWCENVLARRYFFPGCHRVEPYCHEPVLRPLPVTELLASTVCAFPTGVSVGEAAVAKVVELIRFIFENQREIATLLRGRRRPG